ncbi:lipocalin-like domain-containing protein [uncultured Algibacter sp.]|uniref:lipocalin-like domain-containing protein n=1 Tax=uncultured Algibacter sp. TaxID=298659 RepID=UPI0026313C26|nr:lipocalin-like domain-containing protein [uncultured Algibacter sp.]
MVLRYNVLVLFFLVSFLGNAQVWKTYPYNPTTNPTSEIAFPLDEGRHSSEELEWWYVSGHITTNSDKEYSFMLTYFFRPTSVSIFNFDGFRILNITDESDGTFYQDTKALNYTTLSETGLNIEASIFPSGSEFWRNKKDNGDMSIPFEYEISASSAEVSIAFDLETVKRPLIVGGDGKFNQGASSYTYYYSQTENNVTGSLTLNGLTETITGKAWIDRQYGDFNPFTGEDYEWFSIKLDNGTDLNLWNIFNANREIPNNLNYKILSAYVDENQNTQYTVSDFEIERLEYFFTPDNLKSYSKKWRLTSTSKNIDLLITSNYEASEVNISELSFRFFEGATTVTGTINGASVNGVGFAELLHNYEHPDVSLVEPSEGVYDTTAPITWTLNNPDDGRPIKYDLEYSIDNKATFLPISTGLTNTSYTWDGAALSNGDKVWFKVKAYSIDNTFNSEIVSSSSFDTTLGLAKSVHSNFKVYPNPVKNRFTLSFNQPINNRVMEIISLTGRKVYTEVLSNSLKQDVDINFLSNGIYFLRLNGQGISQTIKLIKE